MESKTLVIMAAGMGSRFGGLKQIEPIDEDGNFILHYSAYDAYCAGFNKIVFIIKEEALELFKEKVGKKLEKFINVEYAFQKKDNIPVSDSFDKRVSPWGTAHAIYCAKDFVDGSFAVINSDDFYGRESFKLAFEGLERAESMGEATCVSYAYKNSLWGKETVKRAILDEKDGYINDLIESSIEPKDNEAIATPLNASKRAFSISLDCPVSMNMFSLPYKIFDLIYDEMIDFFNKDRETILNGEIFIPEVLKKAIKSGTMKLKSVKTTDSWMGMTYREDLDKIKARIREYKEEGIYPSHLFEE